MSQVGLRVNARRNRARLLAFLFWTSGGKQGRHYDGLSIWGTGGLPRCARQLLRGCNSKL